MLQIPKNVWFASVFSAVLYYFIIQFELLNIVPGLSCEGYGCIADGLIYVIHLPILILLGVSAYAYRQLPPPHKLSGTLVIGVLASVLLLVAFIIFSTAQDYAVAKADREYVAGAQVRQEEIESAIERRRETEATLPVPFYKENINFEVNATALGVLEVQIWQDVTTQQAVVGVAVGSVSEVAIITVVDGAEQVVATLRDDGVMPDYLANDSVFSGYLPKKPATREYRTVLLYNDGYQEEKYIP